MSTQKEAKQKKYADDSISIFDDPKNLLNGGVGWGVTGNSVVVGSNKKALLALKEKKQKDLKYIEDLFGSNIVTGLIIKIKPCDGGNTDYKEKTGVDFLDENTLILIDENDNVLLVFKEEEHKIKTNRITDTVHILDKYEFNPETIIRKKCVPAQVPGHLMDHLVFYQVHSMIDLPNNNSVDNGGSETKEEIFRKEYLEVASEKKANFFSKYYKEGGMCSLKEMKKHPMWKDEYRNNLKVERVHMCKSCKQQWLKGCCEEYSRKNRIMWQMVIGWSKREE